MTAKKELVGAGGATEKPQAGVATPPRSSRRVYVILLWVSVFILAAAMAFFLWKGATRLEFQLPSDGSGLSGLQQDIRTLDASYAAGIRSQSDFKEIWSMVALLIGAAAAAASILRAPQGLIIVLGAFGGLIFGALQLYSPQLAINSLTAARGKLACIESQVLSLSAAEQRWSARVPQLGDSLRAIPGPLEQQTIPVELYAQRLHDLKAYRGQERAAAMSAVDLALAIPAFDTSDDINSLRAAKYDVIGIGKEIVGLPESQIEHFPKPLLEKLVDAKQRIEEAIDTLGRPQELENLLFAASKAYLSQLAESSTVLAQAQRAVGKAHLLLKEIPAQVAGLEKWPQQLASATAVARRSVDQVHAEFTNAMTRTAAVNKAEEVLAAVTHSMNAVASPSIPNIYPAAAAQVVDLAGDGRHAAPRSESESLTELLEASARMVLEQADGTLKRLAARMERAQRDIERLSPVVEKQLPVLDGVRQLLLVASMDTATALAPLEKTLKEAEGSSAAAAEMLGGVDFGRVESELRACASPTPIAAVPVTGGEPHSR